MTRLVLIGLPALGLAGVIFFITVGVPALLASQPNPTPPEPIYFDHSIHVQVAGLDCAFCHRTASEGVTAGYPDLQQCMFCHQVVGEGQPEIEKVRQAWVEQRPIDWLRIHRMPDHVGFVHEAHIQAGIPCATCHGDVERMGQVTQVRSLRMNDCVSCHQQNAAPTECATCHK
jgi:Cytochrome c7 and related cytochrome c/Class III cytochrome C family